MLALLVLLACSDPSIASDAASSHADAALGRDASRSDSGDRAAPADGGSSSADGGPSRADGGPRTMGRIFFERHYEVEDASELFLDHPVGHAVFVEGGGFGGSNAWEVHPSGATEPEGSIGWHTLDFAPGTTNVLYIGYMLYVSRGLVARMEEGASGKMHDARMHPFEDTEARQTIQWRSWIDEDKRPVGVVPALCKGGAGYGFVRQLGSVPFDLRNYPDQWIWVEMVMDADEGRTALWIETGDGVFVAEPGSPLMERRADRASDWGGETPYVYRPDGWAYPGAMWGYWQRLDGIEFGPDDFVRLDDVVISDAWIEPPF